MQRTGERALSGTPIELAVTATRAIEVQAGRQGGGARPDHGRAGPADQARGRRRGERSTTDGRAWVSATTPRKGKRKAASRLVRIEPANGAISGSVALGTDGGGGLGISPDATQGDRGAGRQAPGGVHRKAALVDLTGGRVIARPPTGGGPGQATYSPDATRLYVSDSARKTLSILSAASAKRLRTLHVARHAAGLVEQPGLALLIGTEGDDTINGTRGADRLIGLGGNDLLRGLRGDDLLEGGRATTRSRAPAATT